jgi:hypothetical protein
MLGNEDALVIIKEDAERARQRYSTVKDLPGNVYLAVDDSGAEAEAVVAPRYVVHVALGGFGFTAAQNEAAVTKLLDAAKKR